MLLDLYTEERQNEFGAVYIKYPRSACDSGPNIVQPKQAIARGANTFRSNPNLRLCIEPRVCFGVGIHPLHIPPAGQRHSGGIVKIARGKCGLAVAFRADGPSVYSVNLCSGVARKWGAREFGIYYFCINSHSQASWRESRIKRILAARVCECVFAGLRLR